jgi:hypothetical protein
MDGLDGLEGHGLWMHCFLLGLMCFAQRWQYFLCFMDQTGLHPWVVKGLHRSAKSPDANACLHEIPLYN